MNDECMAKLAEQCLAHRPAYAWVGSAEKAQELTQLLRSQGKNTPFIGQEMIGRVQTTLVGGRIVFAL